MNETSPTTKAVSIDYTTTTPVSTPTAPTRQSPCCQSGSDSVIHMTRTVQQHPPPCCCWTLWPGVMVDDLPVPGAAVVEPMLIENEYEPVAKRIESLG